MLNQFLSVRVGVLALAFSLFGTGFASGQQDRYSAQLDGMLGDWIDRPVAQLDPVEHAVLWIGIDELRAHLEVPYRVVLNESVELAKKFGATEGHKFINAVLDRAARQLRAEEQAATSKRSPG